MTTHEVAYFQTLDVDVLEGAALFRFSAAVWFAGWLLAGNCWLAFPGLRYFG